MIDERPDLRQGSKLQLNETSQHICTYYKFEDGLWRMLTPYICAFLNTKGGKIIVGVDSSLTIVGLDIEFKQIDNIGLRFDNHMNGISPQVDSRSVSCSFLRMADEKYLVIFDVKPGTQQLYYTSYLFKQTFTMGLNGPRTLNREEIRQRNCNSREFCIQLEDFNQKTNIFVDNLTKIDKFLSADVEEENINLIQIFGNQGSGRSTLVNSIIEKYFMNDNRYKVIQLDFERIVSFEDFYIEILKQFDSNLTNLSSKDMEVLTHEHKTLQQKVCQEEEDESFLFPASFINIETPKYYRLYNIVNNAVYDYKQQNKRVVFALFNATKYVLELIPTYSCYFIMTTSHNIPLQNNIRLKILTLKSKQITVDQLKSYFYYQDIHLSDHTCEKLISYTSGSLPRILKIVGEHKNEVDQFLEQFKQFSLRKQKAYFNDGIFDVPKNLIKFVACLGAFPDVFTYEMMQQILEAVEPEADSQVLIKQLQPYLFKSKGKYFISPGMKSFCLQQVDSAFGLNITCKMIDAMMGELKMINEQYQRMQNIKNDMTTGSMRMDSAYVLQLSAMFVNEWICDFGTTLDACVDLCVMLQYKEAQMLELLLVFAGLKISAEKVRNLKRKVRGRIEAEKEEAEEKEAEEIFKVE
ncbi:Putative_DNA-binding domain-containing protein [Hexamita inflata]|uniref:DNA-binding domain-containing protein n=2 Tax=Hexamita inflata TaxID=28002 RepID=A0AA86R191_9EUKA|nr:Putative DNA-binding domain-containing protein [Hexamita inflata]